MATIIPYPRKPISRDRMFRVEWPGQDINAFITLSPGFDEKRYWELIKTLVRERVKIIENDNS